MSKIPKTAVILPQDTRKIRNAILTKLSDDKFEGKHPNGIDKGYLKQGMVWQEPIVGQSCYVGSLCTSVVTEVIDENHFKTQNSTYHIEYLD